jgi:hypothetical protein
MKENNEVRVDLNNLIRVFDERNDLYKGHTTPITGVIGEDLNAAIFRDYLLRKKIKKSVEVLPYPVNTRQEGGRGPRLDRWIKADNVLYQSEIKSWCSFQIGGYKLLSKTSEQETKKLASRKWEQELREHYQGIEEFGKVSKVLAKMKIPEELTKQYKIAKPLVIHWMPISNKDATPFFSSPVKKLGMGGQFTRQIQKDFTEINYFSCSLYIRELISEGKKDINLSLPNVDIRMDTLKKLVNLK